MTEYTLFSGIRTVYRDLETFSECTSSPDRRDSLEVTCCVRGRCGYTTGQNCYYLGEGDVAVRRHSADETDHCFPTGHFKGITFLLDPHADKDGISGLLEGVDVHPKTLADKFCGEDCFIFTAQGEMSELIAKLCSYAESGAVGRLRIKALELLIMLNDGDFVSTAIDHRCTAAQARTAMAVCAFACSAMNEHYTVEQLSDKAGVKQSQLKGSFRAVYGCSVYAYIRRQKMYTAARLLAETDRTVLDIAVDLGYFNGGKFAKAFRQVIGISPREYRLKNSDQMEHKPQSSREFPEKTTIMNY